MVKHNYNLVLFKPISMATITTFPSKVDSANVLATINSLLDKVDSANTLATMSTHFRKKSLRRQCARNKVISRLHYIQKSARVASEYMRRHENPFLKHVKCSNNLF